MLRSHLVAVCLAVVVTAEGEDTTRQIWDSGFRQKRPPSRVASEVPKVEKTDYRVASGPTPTATAATLAIGFTVWRLRAPARGDEGAARLLVQDTGQPTRSEYVQERLRPGDPLHVGDRVRLGI